MSLKRIFGGIGIAALLALLSSVASAQGVVGSPHDLQPSYDEHQRNLRFLPHASWFVDERSGSPVEQDAAGSGYLHAVLVTEYLDTLGRRGAGRFGIAGLPELP